MGLDLHRPGMGKQVPRRSTGAGPRLSATAPGKVVLLGEYAVLEGAPAISLAINRRARVLIDGIPGAQSEVHAPDIGCRRVPLLIAADGNPDWARSAPEDVRVLALVDQTLRGLAATAIRIPPERAFRLRLDTSEFFDVTDGVRLKLGLGSSAALTVALAAALSAFAGLPIGRFGLPEMLQLHRDFQGGRGSGVDVATSLFGGLLVYQLQASGPPTALPARWPKDLQALFVWSGRAASTPRFLAGLADWRAAHALEYTRHLEGLTAVASDAAAAIRNGDAAAFLRCAAAYAAGLGALGKASAVDIVSAEHAEIGRIAVSGGATYKSCGAGGGDVGVALALDPDILSRLRVSLADAGFACVNLTPDPAGLSVESGTATAGPD